MERNTDIKGTCTHSYPFVCTSMRVCVPVHACLRVCVCACVRAVSTLLLANVT